MNIFQTTSLSKPSDMRVIEPWELAYFQARNRSRVHELVLVEFKKSGISQAELARRLNKQPAVISRLLGAPGNWGLDTVSDLLFAISGSEIMYEAQHPLDAAARNYHQPDWLHPAPPAGGTSISAIQFLGGPPPAATTVKIPIADKVRVTATG